MAAGWPGLADRLTLRPFGANCAQRVCSFLFEGLPLTLPAGRGAARRGTAASAGMQHAQTSSQFGEHTNARSASAVCGSRPPLWPMACYQHRGPLRRMRKSRADDQGAKNWPAWPGRLPTAGNSERLESGSSGRLDTREQRRIQGQATLSMVQSGLMLRPCLRYSFTFIIVPEILQNQGNKLPASLSQSDPVFQIWAEAGRRSSATSSVHKRLPSSGSILVQEAVLRFSPLWPVACYQHRCEGC